MNNTRRLTNLRLHISSQSVIKSINIEYVVKLSIQSIGFQNSSDAINFLKVSIESSVSSGNFVNILRNSSNSELSKLFQNVTALTPTLVNILIIHNSNSPSFSPTNTPTTSFLPFKSSDNQTLSQSGLVGVIISGCFIVCCLFILIGYFTFKKLKENQISSIESNYHENISIEQDKSSDKKIEYLDNNQIVSISNETKVIVGHVPSPYDILGDSSYHRDELGIVLGSDISAIPNSFSPTIQSDQTIVSSQLVQLEIENTI